MFLKNDPSSEKRYYNGMIGEVVTVNDAGIIVRGKGNKSEFQLLPEEWGNYKYVLNEETKEITEVIEGTFRQYPIRLAWAITIHKSQGLTFERAILDFHELENTDASLEKYIHYGGLPYLIHLPMEEPVVMEYLRSIYSTIILKDVIQRKNIRNTVFLEQLVSFLAGNIGNLFSSKSISDFLKSQKVDISPYVVSEYAMALSDAFSYVIYFIE